MTSSPGAGSRVLGRLRVADGKEIVRMEDRYDTDVDDLWSAFTEPHRLARWIAEVEGDLRLGGEFRARFTSGWEGTGRVVHLAGHERCDVKARWDELIPAYRASRSVHP